MRRSQPKTQNPTHNSQRTHTTYNYWENIVIVALCFLACSCGAVFSEEPELAVTLQTQSIETKQAGIIELGNVTITALSSEAITAPGNLLLKILDNFPAVWDTSVKNLRLTFDSSSGLINEAVVYSGEKTLIIGVTQSWPQNSRITITNLKINIPELPSYEEIFSGEVTNLAYLSLSGFQEGGVLSSCFSSNPILLKISPFYAGDDGWSESGSPGIGVVVGYKFTNFQSTYPPGYYLAGRGFQAVAYAVDSLDNWVTSTDTIILSSYISGSPGSLGSATFYTNSSYTTTTTTYILAEGWKYVYVLDNTSETIELKAEKQGDPAISGVSGPVIVEPYAYTISSTSPRTVGIGFSGAVTLKDIHNNAITDTPPASVTITSDGNAYFYPDADYSSGQGTGSRSYTLTSGACMIYIKDPVAENITISANDVYNSLNKGAGGTSNLIVITVSQWFVKMDFAYDEAEGVSNDKLTMRVWLEREGNLVNDINLGQVTLDVYDASSFQGTLSAAAPDSNGVYWLSWEDTGLTAGRSYFAKISLAYAGSTHIGGEDFYLTMNKALGTLITDNTTAIQDLQITADALNTTLNDNVVPQVASAKADTAKAVIATEQTIPADITAAKEELEPHIYAGIINTETQVISGGSLVIRYRAPSGTTPVLDAYDADQTLLVNDAAMVQLGTTGVYEKSLTFESSWGKGFFTVICSEPTYNTLDGITINVVSTDLDKLGRDVSSVMGATSDIQGLGDVEEALDNQLTDITGKLYSINERIVEAVNFAAAGVTKMVTREQAENIYQAMGVVSSTMQDLGVSITGDIKELYDVSRSGTDDLNYVRNKFIELENLLLINKEMMDTTSYNPVIRTWYEFR
ncbi:MAG: hypothetical protein ABH914_01755 [Candidatus Omnitrophota bacterium]